MEAVETRGRPRIYDFNLKKGQVVSMAENKTAQIIALKTAKNNGWKFRTWTLDGVLYVKRIK